MNPQSKRERAKYLREQANTKTGAVATTLRDIAGQLETEAETQEQIMHATVHEHRNCQKWLA
jgi:hypothetical protein